MRIHLIAMGGAVMHNLALALQKTGHNVTGSDDEIYNPAKERLDKAGLLPPKFGWFPEKLSAEVDVVILGMHAKADNPELLRALELGLKVFSFPAYIYQHAKDKKRVVVAGSHGKTTTTSMIMHVLRSAGLEFDFLVGAQLEGFETMVQLSEAPIMVIEGDEYLSSPLDHRPKFLHYRPHVAIVTGVAWDHINVFPTYESYCAQFDLLLENMEAGAKLFYFQHDPDLAKIVTASKSGIHAESYDTLPHEVVNGEVQALLPSQLPVSLQIFGKHNLANLAAARLACLELGVSEGEFWAAASTFKGAAKRLQLLRADKNFAAWLDFAHAPSKAKATVEAVRSLYPERRLIACLELHTFSSLNKEFLPLYAETLSLATSACVFFSPHTLAMKKMPAITPQEVSGAFLHPNLQVFNERTALEAYLQNLDFNDSNLLLMSSGNFGGMDIPAFVNNLNI